jgi:quercetin dioxygenase-like cupin family protein
MNLPDFILNAGTLDLPIPEDIVTATGFRSEKGLVAFFNVHKDVTLPPHSHGAQWGTVLEGSIELTMNGVTRTYGPGESYDIPAGVEHGATVPAGSKLIDIFEESDRYAFRT